MQIELNSLLTALKGDFNQAPPQPFFYPQQLTTDSRDVPPNAIFIPLKGEKFDGHTYIEAVLKAGAIWAFCEQSFYQAHEETLSTYPLLLVEDTLKAYQALARYWRRQLKPTVIAVTGSSGKTSTKEILARVLAPYYQVHKTTLNYNNEIGVPKTLLELRPEHDIAIVEMGMRGLGQIQELVEIAEPNLGIISNIGPVHLSELGSIENVAQAKWELADYLQQTQGTLVITDQDPWLIRKAEETSGLSIIWTGKTDRAQLQLTEGLIQDTETQRFSFLVQGEKREAILNLPGEHQTLNALNCLGILSALGQPLPSLFEIQVPDIFGRYQMLQMPANIRLINDAYNANPDSMRAALTLLHQMDSVQRVAVLGEMGELGPDALQFHQELGTFCLRLNLDLLCVIGEGAWGIAERAGGERFPVRFFETNQAAGEQIPQLLEPGALVLFKASRSAKLEEVVDAVYASA